MDEYQTRQFWEDKRSHEKPLNLYDFLNRRIEDLDLTAHAANEIPPPHGGIEPIVREE